MRYRDNEKRVVASGSWNIKITPDELNENFLNSRWSSDRRLEKTKSPGVSMMKV